MFSLEVVKKKKIILEFHFKAGEMASQKVIKSNKDEGTTLEFSNACVL